MVLAYFFWSIFEGERGIQCIFMILTTTLTCPLRIVTMVVVYFLWFHFACNYYVMPGVNFKAKELREEGRIIKVESTQLQE